MQLLQAIKRRGKSREPKQKDDEGPKVRQAVQSLLGPTSKLEVVSARRNRNAAQLRRYNGAKEDLRTHDVHRVDLRTPSAAHLQPSAVQPPPGLADLDASVNECYLFHATSQDAANGICQEGFKVELAGRGRGHLLNFGEGIYFAETGIKADEFAREEAGLRTMLLCRVTCGNVRRRHDWAGGSHSRHGTPTGSRQGSRHNSRRGTPPGSRHTSPPGTPRRDRPPTITPQSLPALTEALQACISEESGDEDECDRQSHYSHNDCDRQSHYSQSTVGHSESTASTYLFPRRAPRMLRVGSWHHGQRNHQSQLSTPCSGQPGNSRHSTPSGSRHGTPPGTPSREPRGAATLSQQTLPALAEALEAHASAFQGRLVFDEEDCQSQCSVRRAESACTSNAGAASPSHGSVGPPSLNGGVHSPWRSTLPIASRSGARIRLGSLGSWRPGFRNHSSEPGSSRQSTPSGSRHGTPPGTPRSEPRQAPTLLPALAEALEAHVSAESGRLDPGRLHLEEDDCHCTLGHRETAAGVHREFVIDDAARAYVEYVVTYRRLC